MKAYLVTMEASGVEYVVLSTSGSDFGDRYITLKKFLIQVFDKSEAEIAGKITMVFNHGVWNWECMTLKGTFKEVNLVA
jgi:hypothetical protein